MKAAYGVVIIVVVAAVLAVSLGQDRLFGVADDIVSSISSVLSLPDNAIRNVTFNLDVEHSNRTFVFNDPVNVTINSNDLKLYTGTVLEINSSVHLVGMKGNLAIIDNKLNITGSYEQIQVSGVTISSSGTVSSSLSEFSSIFLEGVRTDRLIFNRVSGTLETNGIKMELENQSIEISAPVANFYYTDHVVVGGKANRISVHGLNTVNIR